MSTEALEEVARTAEDKGCDVDYNWHDDYHVLRRVEIDGVELENEDYEDEVNDAYWIEDANRVAERSTR